MQTVRSFHTVEIFLQLEALACRVDASRSAELAPIDCNPLAADQPTTFREANQFHTSSRYRVTVQSHRSGRVLFIAPPPTRESDVLGEANTTYDRSC
jgi:hypothetical protein